MNNGGLARLIYYRGQMLTARDFKDQQEYHREKQKLLLGRFPHGIIGGLEVECEGPKAAPDDFPGFRIRKGLAVDSLRNELIVPEGGIKEPVANFTTAKPYLSLAYEESDEAVGGDACDGNQKNNRTIERVKVVWDKDPNIDPHVTVALIKFAEGKTSGSTCSDFREPLMNPEAGIDPRPIRINARVVDTDQITDFAVTEKKIKNGNVTTLKLAENAVNSSKLADNAVTQSKIFDGAVVKGKLGPGAVAAGNIADDAVVAGNLADDAVVAGNIADDAVVAGNLADDAVVAGNIADDAVVAGNLADNAVVAGNLAANAVIKGNLAANAVTAGNIEDDAVVAGNLADDAVVAGNLADDAVVAGNIADDAVVAGNLADDAVVAGNIADDAVVAGNLADDAVVAGNIADDAVVAGNLADDAVVAGNLADNAVVAGNIAGNAVTTNNIVDGAVTLSKLNLTPQPSGSGTVSPGQTANVELLNASQDAIVIASVNPDVNAELSWTYGVRRSAAGDTLTYIVRVRNENPDASGDPVGFTVHAIVFNGGVAVQP